MREGRVDKILKYAIARASQEEFGGRELGPIHLLKMVYLADVGHAEAHAGGTYTECPWRFHHFGPWDTGAFQRIAPVMEEVGASPRAAISVRFETETTFWSLDPNDPDTERLLDQLEHELPKEVTRAVSHAVHAYGRNTGDLLDFVYRTWPMTGAAPEELLDFSRVAAGVAQSYPPARRSEEPIPSLSRRQQREREAFRQGMLEKLRRTPADGPRLGCVIPPTAPMDEVYSQGIRWLDSLAGDPMPEVRDGILTFDPSIWASDARTPSDLS